VTARERLREQRTEHTELAGALSRDRKREPTVRYRCSGPAAAGRGGCLLVEVYLTPRGELLYRPASKVSPEFAASNDRPERAPEFGALLPDLLEDAGGNPLTGLLQCAHYADDLDAELLAHDVATARSSGRQVRRFLPDGDVDPVLQLVTSQQS
jgi:hypothetical protein